MLLKMAYKLDVKTQTNAKVVMVAENCCSVCLVSDKNLKANVIVKADGSNGICHASLVLYDLLMPVDLILFKYMPFLQIFPV